MEGLSVAEPAVAGQGPGAPSAPTGSAGLWPLGKAFTWLR